jgi:tetratricopeptide (TPR) repeat protein
VLLPCVLLLGLGAWIWHALYTSSSPLRAYADILPENTVQVLVLSLEGHEQPEVLPKEIRALRQALSKNLADLQLEPAQPRLTTLATAVTADGEILHIWVFNVPVHLASFAKGYYEAIPDSPNTLQERFGAKHCWGVDARGRLLSGSPTLVKQALARAQEGQTSQGFCPLERWQKTPTAGALLWGVMDSGSTVFNKARLPSKDVTFLEKTRIRGISISLKCDNSQSARLEAAFTCLNEEDALDCSEDLEKRRELVGALFHPSLRALALEGVFRDMRLRHVQAQRKIVYAKLVQSLERVQQGLAAATQRLTQQQEQVWKEASRVYHAKMKEGDAALKKEAFAQAQEAYTQAQDLFPGNQEVAHKLRQLQETWNRKKQIEQQLMKAASKLAEAEKALQLAEENARKPDPGDALATHHIGRARQFLEQARTLLNQAHDLHPNDPQVHKQLEACKTFFSRAEYLEKTLACEDALRQGQQALSEALEEETLFFTSLDRAQKHFSQAHALCLEKKQKEKLQDFLTGVEKARQAKTLLLQARKALAQQAFSEAYQKSRETVMILQGQLPQLVEGAWPRLREQLGQEAKQIFLKLSDQELQAAQVWHQKGELAAIRREDATARDCFLNYQKFLKKAQSFLREIETLIPPEELRKREQEITTALQVVEGEIHYYQGKSALTEGQQLLKQRAQGSRYLSQAQDRLAEAIAHLEAAHQALAQTSPNKVFCQSLLTEARQAKSWVDTQLQPLEAAANADGLPLWSYEKDAWQPLFHREVKRWSLKPQRSGALLVAPPRELPADFGLRLDFGLVNREDRPANYLWRKRAQLLTLLLKVDENGSTNRQLAISLGRDPTTSQQLAYLMVNQKPFHEIGRLADSDELCHRLYLVREHGKHITLWLDDEKMGEFETPGTFTQIILIAGGGQKAARPRETTEAAPELNAFPVIFQIVLRVPQEGR